MTAQKTRVLMPIAQLGAFAFYLAIGYLYVISGLVVPVVFLVPLWAAWGALLVLGLTHRDDFRYLLGIPLAAGLLWGAVVLGLGSLLDWKA